MDKSQIFFFLMWIGYVSMLYKCSILFSHTITEEGIILPHICITNVFTWILFFPGRYAWHKSLDTVHAKSAEFDHHAAFDQSNLHHPQQNPYLIMPLSYNISLPNKEQLSKAWFPEVLNYPYPWAIQKDNSSKRPEWALSSSSWEKKIYKKVK